ncbi:MAG: hypothetical protein ACREV6_01500 [Clostridium sp.]|uniref:hypothetical protein n=1 Tax=Clostridium sp. TaxID=1506 RepID=UPI003D6D6C70
MTCNKIKKVFLLIFLFTLPLLLVDCNNVDINKNDKVDSMVSQNGKESFKAIDDNVYINYLKKNTSNLDIEDNNDYSSFKLLDKDTKDKDIFLIGEYHYVTANSTIQLKFLKYFKEKTNFKYLLCETPYLASKKYNIFMKTGDEKLLAPYLNTVEELEFWKKLYEFNRTLKSEDKIIVVGPDVGNVQNDISYLIDTLSSKDLPKELQTQLSLIKEYKEYIDKLFAVNEEDAETVYMNSYTENRKKFMNIYNKVNDNIPSYENIFKESSFDIEYVLNDLKNVLDIQEQSAKQYFETGDFASILRVRDVMIGENFSKLYKKLPKGKYFGKYGAGHTYQKEILSESNIKTRNFAAEITKEGSPLKDKVITIACFYDNCFSSNSGVPEPITSYKGNKAMESYVTGNNTLIKLNGKNSPYDRELKWDFVKEPYGRAEGGVTTDYFQYMIVIKNSESDTWLLNRK